MKDSPLSRTSVLACSAPTLPFLGLIIAYYMGILTAREGCPDGGLLVKPDAP